MIRKKSTFSVVFRKIAGDEFRCGLDGFGLTNRQRSIIRSFREEITKNNLKRTFEANTNKLGTLFVDVNNPGVFFGKKYIYLWT